MPDSYKSGAFNYSITPEYLFLHQVKHDSPSQEEFELAGTIFRDLKDSIQLTRYKDNKTFTINLHKKDPNFKAVIQLLSTFCVQSDFFKRYVPAKLIGKGGFSIVYEATLRETRQIFAVKCLQKAKYESVEYIRELVLTEVRIHRDLHHPNIVELYQTLESDSHMYLVLELMRGGDLANKIRMEGSLDVQTTKAVITKLLSAMKYIKERGILHRDLKPENIVFTNDPETVIKLIDFGFATKIDAPNMLLKKCGTPGFVAPELLSDQKYEPSFKSDIFSIGCLMFFCLKGSSPFGKHVMDDQTIMRNRLCKFETPIEKLPALPEIGVSFLRAMLSRDPNARPDVEDLLQHPFLSQKDTRSWTSEMACSPSHTLTALGDIQKPFADSQYKEGKRKGSGSDSNQLTRAGSSDET